MNVWPTYIYVNISYKHFGMSHESLGLNEFRNMSYECLCFARVDISYECLAKERKLSIPHRVAWSRIVFFKQVPRGNHADSLSRSNPAVRSSGL